MPAGDIEIRLTKSQYLSGRHCLKKLYLQVHSPKLATPLTAAERARSTVGGELEALARRLFPTGVAVPHEPKNQSFSLSETQRLLAEGASVLFEASFCANSVFARCDVLSKEAEGWTLIEIKSSTKVKDEHFEDLAFQVHVLQRSGIEVAKAMVCRVDTSNVLDDRDIDPSTLFAFEDVTSQVWPLLTETEDLIKQFQAVLESQAAPEIRTNTHCSSPNRCLFYAHCHEGQHEHDITFLPGIRRESVVRFRDSGVETIKDIPDAAKLSKDQKRARDVVLFSRPYLAPELGDQLEAVRTPAHFIDFEAANPALPVFPGMRPYQAFPFQWSDHVLTDLDTEPLHFDFLHREQSDPRSDFSSSLLDALRFAGTVVYYSPYEVTTVKALARDGIEGAEELLEILLTRGVDLLDIVKGHVYFEAFKGSYSIKKVLPAIVRGLDYSALEIGDGDTAAIEYLRMVSPATTPAEKDKIALNLLEYCKLDTFAMVALFRELKRLASDVKV